ncbi:MAG: DinB family protein [Pirellulaceae bacterium]|nr:DinB family protein [Pirellulaceae bacterium]
MNLATLIEQYSAGPGELRRAVSGLSREQLLARPLEGKWTTLEVVCHIADFEVVFVDRLKAVIAEHEPTLPGRDEGAFAARLAYHQRDLEEELRLVETCRGQISRILRTLTDDDLARRGIHTEAGPLTLEQLLQRIIKHLPHHVQFIHEKRQALGA